MQGKISDIKNGVATKAMADKCKRNEAHFHNFLHATLYKCTG